MDKEEISGKFTKPDDKEVHWWNGVNYHNVIPEELIDAELEHASKNKGRRKNNDEGTTEQKKFY